MLTLELLRQYAISMRTIKRVNWLHGKSRFRQLKIIAFYSSVTSNHDGVILGLVPFEQWKSRNGYILFYWRPPQRRKLKGVLSLLYNHAIRYEWFTFNPISRVRTSQKRLRDKDTPDEFQQLVQQLSVRDRAMVLLIGSTGLRKSEMIALTWSDLNIRTMEVNVLRSCVRNRIGKTKTESSHRPVPVHPLVLSALLEWREQSTYATDLDFLFPSVWFKGNKPLSPSFSSDESEVSRCGHQGCSGTNAAFQLSHNSRRLHRARLISKSAKQA
jgi:integrase